MSAGAGFGGALAILLSLLKHLADPEAKLPLIEFWLLGSLANASRRDALMLVALLLPAGSVLLVLRWRLNLLMLGYDEARTRSANAGRG